MDKTRRSLIYSLPVVLIAGRSWGQPVNQVDSWTSTWNEGDSLDGFFYGQDGPPANAVVGSGDPTADDVLKAFKIIWNYPKSAMPLEVADYIRKESANISGSQGKFNKEWPSRANPLIVNFFAMTNTTPSGDVTPWCAAFVNFCLAAAGRTPTLSAASASFRNHPSYPPTSDPKPGDLVVFQNVANSAQGHVAFFVDQSPDGSQISILGGNQSDGINITPFRRNGSQLRWHSFREVS